MNNIVKLQDGEQTFYQVTGTLTGTVAKLLRVPGMNGEPVNRSEFVERNKEKSMMIWLCKNLYPFTYYDPFKVFTNWLDFPELHSALLLGVDRGDTVNL